MKRHIAIYLLLAFLMGSISTSCSEEKLSEVSIFDDTLQNEPNELDKWLEKIISMPTTLTSNTGWKTSSLA